MTGSMLGGDNAWLSSTGVSGRQAPVGSEETRYLQETCTLERLRITKQPRSYVSQDSRHGFTWQPKRVFPRTSNIRSITEM